MTHPDRLPRATLGLALGASVLLALLLLDEPARTATVAVSPDASNPPSSAACAMLCPQVR